jgi:hypothetical protein
MIFLDIVMGILHEVPGSATRNNGRKANSFLDQLTSHEATASVVVGLFLAYAIKIECLLRFG